jgi:Cupredoxin-like domain
MKNITLQSLVVSALMLSTILVFSVVFNWHGNFMQMGTIAEGKKDSSTNSGTLDSTAAASSSQSPSSSSNTIQLSTKEISPGVYRWISSSSGAINPTLKVSSNTVNTIKIQNPTDTKHELIIDTGADVLPSSDDIKPDSSGQLSFKPTTTGTFTYHCAYHPFTMKGTIQVASGP